MADEDIKFLILGKEYPIVRTNEWKLPEAALARRMTGLTTEEIDAFKDITGAWSALMVVAFARGNPEQSMDRIADVAADFQLKDVFPTGLPKVPPGDVSPPAEGGGGAAEPTTSETSETSTE